MQNKIVEGVVIESGVELPSKFGRAKSKLGLICDKVGVGESFIFDKKKGINGILASINSRTGHKFVYRAINPTQVRIFRIA